MPDFSLDVEIDRVIIISGSNFCCCLIAMQKNVKMELCYCYYLLTTLFTTPLKAPHSLSFAREREREIEM